MPVVDEKPADSGPLQALMRRVAETTLLSSNKNQSLIMVGITVNKLAVDLPSLQIREIRVICGYSWERKAHLCFSFSTPNFPWLKIGSEFTLPPC